VSASMRCPACGALVSSDADWCGQCLRPLREPGPIAASEPAAASVGVGSAGSTQVGSTAVTDAARPTWPCPACGKDNAIELDACELCGTSFATLMRQDDAPPQVEPKDALAWSLIFPGLGHRKVGRGLDGLARGVLFAMLFAMSLVIVVSGVTSSGLMGVFLLFMTMSLAVYFGSAYEAHRLAQGDAPLVSARVLLWVTVGVIMMSVVLLALTVVTAARR
jgi:predicted RNA-binding Zn-ribbon protein involved in translation (DUF1610 family)